MPVTSVLDNGQFFAESLLTACTAQIASDGLPAPALASMIAGAAVPIMDCCNGLVWTRVDTTYPSDGSGQPLEYLRIDFGEPSWAFVLELGVLWCHDNLDPQGNFVDPATERANAHRDSAYRNAIQTALVTGFPPMVKPWALGMRVSPWTSIGPDGACSGGLLTVTVVTGQLAQLV